MAGFFERWRERSRIRRAVRLRRRLRELYGRSATYTPGQVKRACDEAGRGRVDLTWAYAVHCSAGDFASTGVTGDYAALRQQAADFCLRGDAGFAGSEGLSDSHAASFGGGSGDASGGGGFDGGGGGD